MNEVATRRTQMYRDAECFDVYQYLGEDGSYRIETVEGADGATVEPTRIASNMNVREAADEVFESVVQAKLREGYSTLGHQYANGHEPRPFHFILPRRQRMLGAAFLASHVDHEAGAALDLVMSGETAIDLPFESPALPGLVVLAMNKIGELFEGDELSPTDFTRIALASRGDTRELYERTGVFNLLARSYAESIMGAGAQPALAL